MIRLTTAAIAGLTLTALAGIGQRQAAGTTGEPPASAESACYYCDMSSCPDGEHQVGVSNDDPNVEGPFHTCETGTCGDHDKCGAFAVDFSVLEHGDAAHVARLIADNPDWVRINPDREAVQVVDCEGGVIAHAPVSTGTFSHLAALAD